MCRLLFIMVLLLAGGVSATNWPQPRRLAIVVNGSTEVAGAAPNRDNTLAGTLVRYFTFYFSAVGYPPQLTATGIDQLSAERLASDSACDVLLYVDISAAMMQKTTLRRFGYHRERFVTSRGLLTVRAQFQLSEKGDSSWTAKDAGVINEHALPDWVTQFESPAAGELTVDDASVPEPIEYILQRVVERTFAAAHFRSRQVAPPDTTGPSMPVVVLIDQSYAARYRESWPLCAAQTMAAASALYVREFGTRLKIVALAPTRLSLDGRLPIRELYDALSLQYGSHRDTIVVALYDSPNVLQQVMGRDRDEIGLSATGGNLILIRNLPCEHSLDVRWVAQFTSLNFSHELGHRLGAIHVSDAHSLMNHSLSWLAPDHFDDLNRSIVRATINHQLDLNDTAAYAVFLAETIDTTGYSLADIPAIFHRLLPSEGNVAGPKSPYARVKPMYFLAAQAYGHFIHGELADAAELFRKAITLAPDQASLHFYLANCTGGDESRTAWQTAANLGYWMAQIAGRKP